MHETPAAFAAVVARSVGVFAGAAALLAVLGAVPGVLAGPEERTFATIGEAERALQVRLELPSYFPRSLAWPPRAIRSTGRAPATVSLTFTGSEDHADRLWIVQAAGGALAPRLLPDVPVLDSRTLELEGRPARLTRLYGPAGARWHRLDFEVGGRTLAMIFAGPPDELLRLAASVRREGP